MKKHFFLCSLAMAALMMSGCGTTGLLNTAGTQTGSTQATTGALENIIGSVLGGVSKPTLKNLIGTWTYTQPGCAFTSDNLLAQAGGEVAAAEIKQKLLPTYQKLGVKSSNTQVTFKEDGTFAATFAGKSLSGNFTYDESTQKITMQGLLLTINCYAKRNATGIALLFESSKLLTLMQTLSALSGNAQTQAIGEIAKSYDGLRIGFDLK